MEWWALYASLRPINFIKKGNLRGSFKSSRGMTAALERHQQLKASIQLLSGENPMKEEESKNMGRHHLKMAVQKSLQQQQSLSCMGMRTMTVSRHNLNLIILTSYNHNFLMDLTVGWRGRLKDESKTYDSQKIACLLQLRCRGRQLLSTGPQNKDFSFENTKIEINTIYLCGDTK